jgi:hypothetical protein
MVEWVRTLQAGPNVDTGYDVTGACFDSIQTLLERGEMAVLDGILSSFDVRAMNPVAML